MAVAAVTADLPAVSRRACNAIAEQDAADSSLEGTVLTAGAYHVASYAVDGV